MIKEKEVVVKPDVGGKQLTHISILQIIGPILVILGHSLNGMKSVLGISFDSMKGIGGWWHMFSKEWIYIFHMALFFMISGYLFTAKGSMRGVRYKTFVKGKFWRLLFPYLFWNILCYIPKVYFQQFTPDTVSLDLVGIIRTFLSPRQNIWGHTWFLAALFLIYLAAPLWEKIFRNKKAGVVAICMGAVLYLMPIKTLFLALSDLHKDIVFFFMGCALGSLSLEKFHVVMKKYRGLFIAGAVVTSVIFLKWYDEFRFLQIIPCSFILLTLMSISTMTKNMSKTAVELSQRSFGIYIMHWPVMITVRTLCQYMNINLAATIVLVTVCGFVVPNILIYLLRKTNLKNLKVLTYLLGI